MAEYINKEKAKQLLASDFSAVAKVIDKMETEDVAQVAHGRWIFCCIVGEDPYECSVCGNSVNIYGYQYCPNCGAKMDLGVEVSNGG